jgi:hypothetical protein
MDQQVTTKGAVPSNNAFAALNQEASRYTPLASETIVLAKLDHRAFEDCVKMVDAGRQFHYLPLVGHSKAVSANQFVEQADLAMIVYQ